jgi:hypothetical protein
VTVKILRILVATLLSTFVLVSVTAQNPGNDSVYKPLRLYNGSWTITMRDESGAKPITNVLVNTCSLVGRFFVCQQTVNGKVDALVIFAPSDSAGHYFTQSVMPDGSATGRGELVIDGSHWVFSSKEDDNGKSTFYRTTNDFTGADRIHFESAQSADGKSWTTTRTGDEVHGSVQKH